MADDNWESDFYNNSPISPKGMIEAIRGILTPPPSVPYNGPLASIGESLAAGDTNPAIPLSSLAKAADAGVQAADAMTAPYKQLIATGGNDVGTNLAAIAPALGGGVFGAEEGALGQMGGLLSQPYFEGAVRNAYPGIYKDPRILAQEAAAQVAPEDPALKQLFGVTRQDLYDIGQQGTRQGNKEPQIAGVKNPKGSYTNSIMTPQNAQRLVDALGEAPKSLIPGMDAWYVMDPAYQRLEQLVGPEQAAQRYAKFNNIGSMFSPGSDVETEINRGTAAHMMAEQGKWPDFMKYGGMAAGKRGADFPQELKDVIGHPYHSTAQAGPANKYLQTGSVDMTQPKVPLYMQASGVPETGFQTTLPVPDAHFTRASGMSDVRKNANPGASMKTPEYAGFGPWFRENVANPLGIQAVPAQARMWGLYSPQTGVDTPIGAPKLELLAKRINERAQKLGVDPAALRDQVLMGQAHAVNGPGAVPLASLLAGQNQQQ